MNNKKIFKSALLCALLIMTFMVQSVSAAGGFVVDVTDVYNDEITITGSSDSTNEGDSVSILVLNPDYTPEQAKANPAAIQHQWVVAADAAGEFTHIFRLNLSDDFEKGTFNIYVGGKTFGAIASEPYSYTSFNKVLEYAKNTYNNFTDSEIMNDNEKKTEAIAYFEKSASLLEFTEAFYAVDAENVADNIAEVFEETPIDFKDGKKAVDTFVKVVNLHSVLEAFRTGKKDVLFGSDNSIKVDDIVGLSAKIKENTSLDISLITPEGIKLVNEGLMVSDIEDEDDLARLYAKNIVLQSIKNNTDLGYDFLSSVLTENNTKYAQLSVPDYIGLSDKETANELIVRNKDSITLSNLESKIKEYAEEGESEEEIENPPKGGGSFSSGGKITVIQPVEEEPVEIKPTEVFADLAGYTWAKESIESLASKGIIAGKGNGSFAPGENLTREQAIKIVVLALGLNKVTESTEVFADEKEGAWYCGYLAIARDHGIANGVGDNLFGIGNTITRQDFVTLLYRALKTNSENANLSFADKDEIAPYSKDAVAYFSSNGIVNGYTDGTFKPGNSVTRAEAAKIVYELLKRRDA